ncbi:outer membrane protein transport protein [Ferrimonas balearica]|uniref:outer membrane protein transport protein n=1 Tax=Ferrimonas balearica TaxID=44012 RepID=UPI001C970123|nr:outer membrane protein transport protein [Ferrimonas balearica]MBY5982187.1 outer membrane protein transport protein [Ferrimonas balearica]
MKYRLLSGAIAALLAGQANAAGFQLAETSASGLGRAFAGEAAIADNAAAQGRNPALLTQLEGRQLSVGAILVAPDVATEGTITHPHLNPDMSLGMRTIDASEDDLVPNAVVPNFFYSNRLSERWAYGLAINSNYGLKSELPATHPAAIFGSNTEITTVEFNPNIAFAVNEQFSLGAGVRFVYGDGAISGTVPGWVADADVAPLLGMVGLPPVAPGTELKSLSGDDYAWGYKLGATWQPAKGHTIGLSYHSEVELNLEGDAGGLLYAPDGMAKPGQLALTLPAFAELASSHQLTDAWRLSASINWTQWSRFDDLVAEFPDGSSDLVKAEQFEDNWRFAVGTDYRLNDKMVVRAGVAYDMTAVEDEHRTLSIPDSNRLWFSTGMGYAFSDRLNLDLAVTYIHSQGDAPISESFTVGEATLAQFNGEVTGSVWLAGAQLSYKL